MLKNHMIKCASVLLLCFSTALPASKLLPQYTPITSRMMVYAIGIDKDGEKFKITLAANNVETASETDVVSAEGETFYSALSEAEKAASKEIFLGHTGIIIIGQEAANDNFTGFLDYTARNFRMRMNIKLLTVMNSTAKEILDLKGEAGNNILFKLDSLINTVTTASDNCTLLNRVVQDIANEETDPVTLAVKVITNENTGEKELSLAGFALYKDESLNSFITEDIADVYSLINGKYKVESMTVDADEKISVEIVTTETKIKYTDQSKLPKAQIELLMTCSITEKFGNQQNDANINDELIPKCASAISQKLENEAQKLISYTKEKKIDVFRLVDGFSKMHPYKRSKISLSADEIYTEMEIEFKVSPTVTNSNALQKE